MSGLNARQKNILQFLQGSSSGASLDEISAHLKVTRTAAKEQIVRLVGRGYVGYRDQTGSVGRPLRFYFVTDAGAETFPRQYSWLSNQLLELLARDLGPDKSARMMENLAEMVFDGLKARFGQSRTTKDRLKEATLLLNELGYRADLRQSDLRKGAVIEATNCVYHSVAKKHPGLCQFDIRLLKLAVDRSEVVLESCIARGGSTCRFCIR